MRALIMVAGLGLSLGPGAWASVKADLSADNARAVIVVTDDSNGGDARKLFDALTVRATVTASVRQKEITSSDGAFNLLCGYDQAASSASCEFRVLSSASSVISSEEHRAKYAVGGETAARFHTLFVENVFDTFRYSTSKAELEIIGSDDYFRFSYSGK